MSAIHSSNRWTEVASATVVSCIEASGLQPGVERGRREESVQFPKHVPAFSEIGDLMPHTFLCPKPPEYLWLINAINLRLKISWRQLPFMAEFQISHTPCTAISFLPQYKFLNSAPWCKTLQPAQIVSLHLINSSWYLVNLSFYIPWSIALVSVICNLTLRVY